MFSAYATVVLAVERFLAVSRPVEYHIMMTATGNRYVIPFFYGGGQVAGSASQSCGHPEKALSSESVAGVVG